MRRMFLVTTVLVLLSRSIAVSADVLPYTLTPLGSLSGHTSSFAYDLSESGEVVGCSSGPNAKAAFIWDATHGMRNLETGGRSYSEARGINDVGQVVGYWGNPETTRSFLWENGLMNDLPMTDSHLSAYGPYSQAYDVNDSGITAGNFHDYLGLRNSTIWNNSFIEPLEVSSPSYATDINNVGQVIGYRETMWGHDGFIWDNGDLRYVASGFLYGINESGQVVGTHDVAGCTHAMIWRDGIGVTDIGTLDGSESWAYGINDDGSVVGSAQALLGTTNAFLWRDDIGIVDLNDYLDESGSGWILNEARAINNQGQIVGWGTSPAGSTEAFLLTPMPEPSSAIVLLIGLGAIFRFRRRSK